MRLVSLNFVTAIEKGSQISVESQSDFDSNFLRLVYQIKSRKKIVKMRLVSVNFVTGIEKGAQMLY